MCLLPYSIIEHQTSARDTSQQVALANVFCCSIPNTIRKDPIKSGRTAESSTIGR